MFEIRSYQQPISVEQTDQSSGEPTLVLNKCVGEPWVSSQPLACNSWIVGVPGKCQDTGKLFTAQVNVKTGENLHYQEVTDTSGLGLCAFVSHILDSCALDLSASSVSANGSLIMLLSGQSKDATPKDIYVVLTAEKGECDL